MGGSARERGPLMQVYFYNRIPKDRCSFRFAPALICLLQTDLYRVLIEFYMQRAHQIAALSSAHVKGPVHRTASCGMRPMCLPFIIVVGASAITCPVFAYSALSSGCGDDWKVY